MQIGSEPPVPGKAKKESTAIRTKWGTKSPGLGEAQMETRYTHQVQVRSAYRPESPDPEEALVGTGFTR